MIIKNKELYSMKTSKPTVKRFLSRINIRKKMLFSYLNVTLLLLNTALYLVQDGESQSVCY